MDLAISASGVCKSFGKYLAVNQLDLSIPTGVIYGFLGPNGSGKSTSIRLLTGLLLADSGNIEVLGMHVPQQAETLRTRIGYMTQKFSLFGDLTVKENLEFMARIYGLDKKSRQSRINTLLDQYDLEAYSRQLAGSLSGGQKQRLGLASAVIHEPELLFLDEPTSAVDPENRRDFWEKLFDLSDKGTTILVSTHYMDEAERCHYLAILESGVKRAGDTPQNLMDAMNASVVEISGKELRKLKATLMAYPEIISAAQQGVRLRVLVDKKITSPLLWLNQKQGLKEDTLKIVRPSLEDVFITCTGTLAP